MRTELISVWYNEEFLAPFFFSHYSWVDRIHILLDADTDDNTEKIAAQYQNVSIERFKFPDMMDDLIKSRKINEKYRTISDADYVIVVDSDEFIICNEINKPVKSHIAETGKNIYFSVLWQTYRHEEESNPDAGKAACIQRIHGDPAIANCNIKPTIARAGKDIVWGVGNHSVVYEGKHLSWLTPNAEEMLAACASINPADMTQGAHWRLFDLEAVITRRTRNRSSRQSRVNLEANLSSHLHRTSRDEIISEFEKMKQCPVVIKNRQCSPDINYTDAPSIFERLLAEPAFAEAYDSNRYQAGVADMYESSNIPEWYESVKPQTPVEAMADELFLLASEYQKAGNSDKAVSLLKKALLISPNSAHCRFYLSKIQADNRDKKNDAI